MIRKLRRQVFFSMIISIGFVFLLLTMILNVWNSRRYEREKNGEFYKKQPYIEKNIGKNHIAQYGNKNGVKHTFPVVEPNLLLVYSIVIYCIIMFLTSLVALWISRKIVTPVEEAFERQRRFISDASHELKTPVAVIRANTELLEMDYGDNKWLNYIDMETKRMDHLLQDMLTLASTEQQLKPNKLNMINVSKEVKRVALPFESVAFEKQVKYQINIEEEVILPVEEGDFRQLGTILLDNAMKHVSQEGTVWCNLTKKPGKQGVILSVSNTGKEIEEKEQAHIFERFYRIDKSRNREEGRYGLGLAIAKNIVDKYHGTIKVRCEAGVTSFVISI